MLRSLLEDLKENCKGWKKEEKKFVLFLLVKGKFKVDFVLIVILIWGVVFNYSNNDK